MKLFERSWILRIDPKDPNAIPGMNIQHWTGQKFLRNVWVAEGIPLRALGYQRDGVVRVKWVSTVISVFVMKNNKNGSSRK